MIVWLNGTFGVGKTTVSGHLSAINQVTGQHLVAAQSVLVEGYWREILAGLADLRHDVFHVLLDADAGTLHARIDADDDEPVRIRPWRHRHVEVYESALDWLRPAADLVVDTQTLDAPALSRRIQSEIGPRL